MEERKVLDQTRLIFKSTLKGDFWLVNNIPYRHQFENLPKIDNRKSKTNHFRFIDDEVGNVHFEKPKQSNQDNWNNRAVKMKCLASRFFLVEVFK